MLIFTQDNTLFDTKTQKFQDVHIEQNMLHLVSSEGNGTPILQYKVDMILHTNQKVYCFRGNRTFIEYKNHKDVSLLLRQGFYVNNENKLYHYDQYVMDIEEGLKFEVIHYEAIVLTNEKLYVILFGRNNIENRDFIAHDVKQFITDGDNLYYLSKSGIVRIYSLKDKTAKYITQDISVMHTYHIFTNFKGETFSTDSSWTMTNIRGCFITDDSYFIINEFGKLLRYAYYSHPAKCDSCEQFDFVLVNDYYTILVDIDGAAYVWEYDIVKLPDYITFTKEQQPTKSARE
jgi:hypothetical protein